MADHVDIGFARGAMSDGRGWELIVFAQDQHTFANYVFASHGIENYDKAQFRELLEREGLVRFSERDSHSGSASLAMNKRGDLVWNVFVLVGDEDGVISAPLSEIQPMSQFNEDQAFAIDTSVQA